MIGLIPLPRFTALDANGDPWVGAKLYTFETGTTTPKITYTDNGGGTPNTNPIILDQYGQADVWLNPVGGAYRLRFDSPDDVTIWTSDGISQDYSEFLFIGLTEPTVTYAYLFWHDLTTSTIKQRNAANTGWITILNINQTTGIATPASFGFGVDEDDMVSDSAVLYPTEQSVKAYFDSNVRPIVIASEAQANGVQGGTFTAGSLQQRIINSIDLDTAGIASLSSNRVLLPAGSYICSGYAPAYKVDSHQAQLYDFTGVSTLILGSTELSSSGDASMTKSIISGPFTLSQSSYVGIYHKGTTTQATNGFGYASGLGYGEIYSKITFVGVS